MQKQSFAFLKVFSHQTNSSSFIFFVQICAITIRPDLPPSLLFLSAWFKIVHQIDTCFWITTSSICHFVLAYQVISPPLHPVKGVVSQMIYTLSRWCLCVALRDRNIVVTTQGGSAEAVSQQDFAVLKFLSSSCKFPQCSRKSVVEEESILTKQDSVMA